MQRRARFRGGTGPLLGRYARSGAGQSVQSLSARPRSRSTERSKQSVDLTPTGLLVACFLPLSGVVWFLSSRVSVAGVIATGLLLMIVVDYRSATGSIRKVRIEMSGPPAAVAGEALTLDVLVSHLKRPVRLDVRHDIEAQGFLVDSSGPGHLTIGAPQRGVMRFVYVDLKGRGVVGVWRARRRIRVWMRRPVFLGPRPLGQTVKWPSPRLDHFGDAKATAFGRDLYRSTREYRRGDPRRHVNWPATAHTGSLMVREHDGTGVVLLNLLVEIGKAGPAAEIAAARAAWVAEEALQRGWVVNLVTQEAMAPLPRPFPVRNAAGQFPPEPLHAGPVTIVERLVDGQQDLRQRLAEASSGYHSCEPRRGLNRIVSAESGDRWL